MRPWQGTDRTQSEMAWSPAPYRSSLPPQLVMSSHPGTLLHVRTEGVSVCPS